MIPNVQAISAKLAAMPDDALQKYAAMNKNDPYILALTVSESNRRQSMRNAAQAQPMADQPPVADQMIAGMAPQPEMAEMGIAAIAPEDVAEFADGGIVSFAGGGDPELESLYAARERYLRAGADTTGIDQAIAFKEAEPNRRAAENRTLLNRSEQPQLSGWEAAADQLMADTASGPEPDTGVREVPGMAAGLGAYGRRGVASGTTPVYNAGARTLPSGERINSGTKTAAAPGGAAPKADAPAAGARIAGIPGMEQYLKMLRTGQEQDAAALRNEQEGINRTEQENAAAERAAYEAEIAARGKLGAEREQRLKDKEGRLAEREDKAPYYALLEAGLAMMAGESPHAFVNIGKGAAVGTKAYRESVSQIESARDALNESFAELEDARRAEDITTAEGRRRYSAAERAAKLKGQQAMFTLNKSLGYDANREDAKLAFEAAFKAREGALNREATVRAASIRADSGGKTDLQKKYDMAVDNAQKRMDLLLKTPSGVMMEPAQLEATRRKYLAEEMANLGLQMPSGAAGAASSSSGWGTATVVSP